MNNPGLRAFWAVAKQEFRLLATDPFAFMLLVVMPLALLPFFTGGLLGGAVTSVPGMSAMFGFLGMGVVVFVYMRDHGWRTWDRLRTSRVSPLAVVLGKALPLIILFVAQQLILLAIGYLLLGMPWKGSILAGAVMIVLTALAQVSLGLAVSIHSRSIHHANIVTQAGSLVAAGIGGAFNSIAVFPRFLQHLAPFSPVYWPLKGIRGIVALGWGFDQAGQSMLVLAGMTVGALALTVSRYRHDEVKIFYV